MDNGLKEPIRLERKIRWSSPWGYVLTVAPLGAFFRVVAGELLDFGLQNILEFIDKDAPLRLGQALIPIR